MVELDSYLEGLYDDLPAKTKSTGLILHLARVPENLLELADNGIIYSLQFYVVTMIVELLCKILYCWR